MLDILAITSPIYLVVLAGYLATRGGVFHRADMAVFGKFVLNLALPALIFNALAQRRISEVLHPTYLLAYLGGSLLSMTVAYLVGRRLCRWNATRSTFLAMGVSCSNSSFIGYPILLLMVAPVAGVALALNVLIENLVMLPLLLALAESARGSGGEGGGGSTNRRSGGKSDSSGNSDSGGKSDSSGTSDSGGKSDSGGNSDSGDRVGNGHAWQAVLRQSLLRLVRNPLVLAVVAGLALSLAQVDLPQPLLRTVNLFAQASGGLSLFAIGGMLVGLPLRTGWQKVVPIVLGKLVGHPLAVLLVLTVVTALGMVPLTPQLRAAALLMAAMPMLSIYPILGQAYGEADRSAATLLLCMVASFFSLSAWLWVLR